VVNFLIENTEQDVLKLSKHDRAVRMKNLGQYSELALRALKVKKRAAYTAFISWYIIQQSLDPNGVPPPDQIVRDTAIRLGLVDPEDGDVITEEDGSLQRKVFGAQLHGSMVLCTKAAKDTVRGIINHVFPEPIGRRTRFVETLEEESTSRLIQRISKEACVGEIKMVAHDVESERNNVFGVCITGARDGQQFDYVKV